MPSKEQTAEAAEDIAEKLSRLGFGEISHEGPIEIEDDGSTVHQHYIYANKNNSVFYFQLLDKFEFGRVVYSYDIARTIGKQLSDEEIRELVDVDSDKEIELELITDAGVQIIEQTPSGPLNMARFNIAAYATTALVDYREGTTVNGFPSQFQCTRGIFPYNGNMTLRNLDDRVETTLTAGDRGARYVGSALLVDKDQEDPSDYVVVPQF